MGIRWVTDEEFRVKLAKGVRPLDAAVRKAAPATVEFPEGEERLVKFTLSDDAVDRDKDVVSSKGWDLTAYKANPVVCWAHDYEQLPIARAVSIGVEDGKLKAVAEFMPKELNPMADTIFRMIKGGWLRGNSVGFKPKDYDYNLERKGVDYHAQELLEFSIVPIPSHPGALAEAKAAGIDTAIVEKWATTVLKAIGGGDDGAGRSGAPKYGSRGGPEHARGTGDPLRDTAGCTNGDACPKMKDQPCPMAEGCPMQKGVRDITDKRGRVISAKNEAALQAARDAIDNVLALVREDAPEKAVVKTIEERDGKFVVLAEDGKVLGEHDSKDEALAQLGAIEAHKNKSPSEAVEELLLEIEDAVQADSIELGDGLTPETLAETIAAATKSVAQDAFKAAEARRAGRVD